MSTYLVSTRYLRIGVEEPGAPAPLVPCLHAVRSDSESWRYCGERAVAAGLVDFVEGEPSRSFRCALHQDEIAERRRLGGGPSFLRDQAAQAETAVFGGAGVRWA